MKKPFILLLSILLLAAGLSGCNPVNPDPLGSSVADAPTESQGETEKPVNPEPEYYHVSFESGLEAEGEGPTAMDVPAGYSYFLPSPHWTVTGMKFIGWKAGKNEYAMGEFVTIEKDTVFTALWEEDAGALDYYEIGLFDDGDPGDWDGIPSAYIEEENSFNGTPYLVVYGTDALIFRNQNTVVDLSNVFEEGYFHFAIWVEDASKVLDGQFEITSSGTADQNEINVSEFSLDYPLSNGWNEFDIPLREMKSVGGDLRLKNVNYFRLYLHVRGVQGIGLDDVYIHLKED